MALKLATHFGVPIISVDSRQCYKYLNIGTAKPSCQSQSDVVHHNIDVLEPTEPESVGKFLERAKTYPDQGDFRLYVGGSTLHLSGLLFGLDEVPPRNEENQRKIMDLIGEKGKEFVHKQLATVDPKYAQRMDGFNTQRIVRALDVYMQTGKPFSSFHTNKKQTLDSTTLVLGLKRDRKSLYQRIDHRVVEMFNNGWVGECIGLLENGFSPTDPALDSIGYSQIIEAIGEAKNPKDCIPVIQKLTRQYAKRQETWFKRWDFVEWFDVSKRSDREVTNLIMHKITTFCAS